MKKIHWIKLATFKYSLSDILDYLRANVRYKIYYSGVSILLMTEHIREQIDFRINIMMDKECYNSGSCKVCGCTTTHLQMANKMCEGKCYPTMMTKWEWEMFKRGSNIIDDDCEWVNRKPTTLFRPYHKQYIIRRDHKHTYNGMEKNNN